MEFTQLRYFITLAETGSFVKAAEKENVAQPSLSQQIRKLETELGFPLFDRLGRGVKLTQFGEALLPRAREILFQVSDARRQLESVASADAGRLTVGAIPTVLPFSLAEPLAAFRQKYPGADLRIVESTTDILLDGLRTGRLDLAIVGLPVKVPEIVCSELYREPLLAVLPETHPHARAKSLTVADLRGEPMLLLREGHCLREDVLTACSRGNYQFEQTFESDHIVSLLSLVAAGFGISIAPLNAARDAAGCATVPLTPAAFRRIGYAQVKSHHAVPLQKRLIEFLRAWKYV